MILDECQGEILLFSSRPEKQLVHEPSRLTRNEQKSERELNEFSIMHLSGERYKGEKHTKEHESRRAAEQEEVTEKSVKQQQQNIIITHITSRSEKSHSFSTRNAL